MRRTITAAGALLLAACAREAAKPPPPDPVGPPNVVLLVGDGLGMGAWSLARVVAEIAGEELAMDSPEASGFLDPRAADNPVTDSAAAATAWATGRLSSRFRVGLPDAGVPNLFERLEANGRAFGFVTTARVTHYTLSPFYARTESRSREDDIAAQLIGRLPDVAIGGGARHFLPPPGGGRRDGRDLLAEAEAKGAAVLREVTGPLPADRPVLAVLAASHLPHELDRREDDPSLEMLAVLAVRRLDAAGEPWFLLVEGARIDHAGHDHDGASLVRDTVGFDRTIRAVLGAVDPARTLIVAAADHETANPTLLEFAHPESLDVVSRSVEAMEELIFGGEPWPGAPESLLERALPVIDEGSRHTGLSAGDLDRMLRARNVYERRMALGNALSRRFGIAFLAYDDHLASDQAHGHTGDLVPVRAWGVRAGEVAGIRTHDRLGAWIADVLALPPPGPAAAPAAPAAAGSPGAGGSPSPDPIDTSDLDG
jgi:alkaline phosphatase